MREGPPIIPAWSPYQHLLTKRKRHTCILAGAPAAGAGSRTERPRRQKLGDFLGAKQTRLHPPINRRSIHLQCPQSPDQRDERREKRKERTDKTRERREKREDKREQRREERQEKREKRKETRDKRQKTKDKKQALCVKDR